MESSIRVLGELNFGRKTRFPHCPGFVILLTNERTVGGAHGMTLRWDYPLRQTHTFVYFLSFFETEDNSQVSTSP